MTDAAIQRESSPSRRSARTPGTRASRVARRQSCSLVDGSVSPVVRWVGGKSNLLGRIVPLVPRQYRRYLEPFLGGGALFFCLRPAAGIVSDACEPLVELYQEIRKDAGAVHRELSRVVLDGGRDPLSHYYDIRSSWNRIRASWSPARRAGAFLYLNHSCYNGLWRVNRAGGFNTPVGSFASGSPTYPDLGSLTAAGVALQSVEVLHQGYQRTLDRAIAGDLVYLDPPYPPALDADGDEKRSGFTSYSASGFGLEQHEELARSVRGLVARGVEVVVSLPDTPRVRGLYAGLVAHAVSARRSVGAGPETRSRARELVLVSGSEGAS